VDTLGYRAWDHLWNLAKAVPQVSEATRAVNLTTEIRIGQMSSRSGQPTGHLSTGQQTLSGQLPTPEAEDGSAELQNPKPQRIHQLVLEDVIHDEFITDAIVKPQPAGPSGLSAERDDNADAGLTALCAAAEAKNGTPSGRHDPMDTDELGMEGPSEVPDTSTNKIDKGKGVEKQQSDQAGPRETDQPDPQQKYDPRERLPPFLINTELGDILLPAIIRGYQNDPMAQNGVRKPFKWHREQYIVLDDPSITENLRLYIPTKLA
jgi:hypothetical protein